MHLPQHKYSRSPPASRLRLLHLANSVLPMVSLIGIPFFSLPRTIYMIATIYTQASSHPKSPTATTTATPMCACASPIAYVRACSTGTDPSTPRHCSNCRQRRRCSASGSSVVSVSSALHHRAHAIPAPHCVRPSQGMGGSSTGQCAVFVSICMHVHI